MQINADELRFISPSGVIISSPEQHFHSEVIAEKKLGNNPEASIIDVVQNGFAIIVPFHNELMISHICELTAQQKTAICQLKTAFPNYNFSIIKDAI
ncbi:unknown [Clostridium sp. CAG:492]|nr:unknown [Clostridium sp. CAG:492]